MLTETSLGLISAINYFFVPVISLRIYGMRHKIKWVFSAELFYLYALMCVINLPAGRVAVTLVERLFYTTQILADSTRYTIVAIAVAIVIPYAIEVVEKLIKIEVEIKLHDTKHQFTST